MRKVGYRSVLPVACSLTVTLMSACPLRAQHGTHSRSEEAAGERLFTQKEPASAARKYTLAQAERDSKGLQRDSNSAASEGSALGPQGGVLQGNIKKDFPTPDMGIESDHDQKSDESSSSGRLQAIISKSGQSPFDRYMQQGYDAFVQGRLDESEKQYTLAIKELKKTGVSDLRLAKARNGAANALQRAGNLGEAKQTYELALKTARQNPVPNLEEAKALAGLGAVARDSADYKRAEDLLKQAIDARQKVSGEGNIGVAQGLFDLGELYRQQKLYGEAEPVYQLALETLNKAKDVPDLTKAYYLDKTGMLFHDQAKMPEAKRCFAMALELKDKYSTLYTPVDGRKRGLVYYRCENGYPNAARVFTRQAEIEYLHIKDAVAVATLTAQIFAHDWYLLKAEVTIQNQGKSSITACSEPPTLSVETPKRASFAPLDSDAIAGELGARGSMMYDRLLHSADFAYTINSFNIGSTTTAAMTPFGLGLFNTVGSWTSITPDWGARIAARNSAISALASAQNQSNTVLQTKPSTVTIGPGESATFQVFYPYEKFKTCTLRFLVGNTVMEFPFTDKSG